MTWFRPGPPQYQILLQSWAPPANRNSHRLPIKRHTKPHWIRLSSLRISWGHHRGQNCYKTLDKENVGCCQTTTARKTPATSHKTEQKPKLLSVDIFRWGSGLPQEGAGAKKFGMSLETTEIKLFWPDIPGFCWDIPAVPETFEKNIFVFNFWALNNFVKVTVILQSKFLGLFLAKSDTPVAAKLQRKSSGGIIVFL